jgi:hypothetical protein
MITPAYVPTATERVLPRMALDFTTASLDSRVTVTRALNTATRINSSGLIETVNANLPRFDYTLNSGGDCKGLLIEETRENLLAYSNEFNNTTGWFTGLTTVTPNIVLSPDGTQNADTLSFPALANANLQYTTPVSVTAGQTYTATVYIRADAPVSNVKFSFITYGDLTTPAITTTWQRFTVTVTATGSTLSPILVTRNAVATTIYIYGFQLEAGAFATSYIPTTTTSLTRNADVVDMTGTNFSDWYNATEGTIYAEYTPFTVSGTQRGVFSINDGTANNSADWRPNGGDFVVISGGATQADIYPGGITVNTIGKGVLALKANNVACAINGNAIVKDTDNTALMPVSPNKLNIGRLNNSAALSICGWMRKIMYWPQRMTDAEIRAFSK